MSASRIAMAILYGISDLDGVLSSNGSVPLAWQGVQAVLCHAEYTDGHTGVTFASLFTVLLSLVPYLIGMLLTVSNACEKAN